MMQDEIELLDIMTSYDWFIWMCFHDNHPTWKLLSYGDRVSIEGGYGWIRINAVSMEKAIETANRELKNKYCREYYLMLWTPI